MSMSRNPFALSQSKGCPSLQRGFDDEVQGFDKLSPNGFCVGGKA